MIQLTYTTYLMRVLSLLSVEFYICIPLQKQNLHFFLFFYESTFSSNVLGEGAAFFDGSLCDWIWFFVFFSNWLFGGV